MKKRNSLKYRMVFNFLLVIFLAVSVTDIALVKVLQSYFYNNVSETLESQLKISADFYERYFSGESLQNNIYEDVDAFWKQTDAQVQIIDLNGVVILDSQGNRPEGPQTDIDIVAALTGGTQYWIFNREITDEKVMALSYPLRNSEGIVGALRFITSLKDVDASLQIIALNFGAFGLAVMVAAVLLSFFLSKRIITPIDKLTETAEVISSGNYNVISTKYHEDEIGKLSDTLNYMTREIRKKEALKNDFISSISHELRTPLTSIKGWAITLQDEHTDQELMKDGLEIISKETDRLKDMVDELLDFSKFVSGKVELEVEKVDISRLFDFIRKHMEDRAKREGKRFLVKGRESMGILTADPNRLKQVFINLIDNAFKFTGPGGEIIVDMRLMPKYVDFIVKDNGIGIGEEDIVKVKEKFYKGKTSNSANGIGLSICDEIAKLHGGELLIVSKAGEGTEITLRLPFKGAVSYEKST